MPKIILAFDSFKGSATSREIADAAAVGIARVWDGGKVVRIPIADGGEGTTDALAEALGAQHVSCRVCDPLGNEIEASYAIADSTAIIEVAAASGITLVPTECRNPMLTSTYGTGQLIADALLRGCRDFILGLGGSATNDAAMGILAALGTHFFDAKGNVLKPCGKNLKHISSVDTSALMSQLHHAHFTLACDVDNPFCGHNGAAHIYAPQKGADDAEVRTLDNGMKHYAGLISHKYGLDIASLPGSGAAGGVCGGLLPFVDCSIKSGIDTILDALHFDDAIRDADLILTGEGKIDAQSAMGKAVGGITRRAAAHGIPVIALAGIIEDDAPLRAIGLSDAICIHPPSTPQAEAMQKNTTLAAIANISAHLAAALQT